VVEEYGLSTLSSLAITTAAFETGHWVSGIGDPTAMGWITTLGYALGAALCGWVSVRCRFRDTTTRVGRPAQFWLALGIIMGALAVNKQLDLQMWFWQTGKTFAKSHGLYENRQLIQWASMGGIVLAATGVVLYFKRLTRGAFREYALALLGVLFILCFVIIRASSLHHIDQILGRNLGGIKINWILENCGILLVIVGAIVALGKSRARHYVQFRSAPSELENGKTRQDGPLASFGFRQQNDLDQLADRESKR
jgi:hypothetical protein